MGLSARRVSCVGSVGRVQTIQIVLLTKEREKAVDLQDDLEARACTSSTIRYSSLVKELLVAPNIAHVVREIDEQLSEATLGCGVIAEDGRESGVTKGLGQALTKRFTGASVVAQTDVQLVDCLDST